MSNPLSSLKKIKRNPFHLNVEEEMKRMNIPYRSVPQIGLRYTDDESKLLEEITQASARKSLDNDEITNPFHAMSVTDKRPGDISPHVLLRSSAPDDQDLISVMASRLQQLEQRVQHQSKEIADKNKRIKILEEKVQLYQKAQADAKPSEVQDLRNKCLVLQNQIQEMEDFLADYGMMWVGEHTNKSDDVYLNISSDPGNEDEGSEEEEQPAALRGHPPSRQDAFSQARLVTPIKPNFDLILTNIAELNDLAGDGVAQVLKTQGGATLKMPESVPLTLYSNGIMMFGGPFRPYEDPETQACIQDLTEGYFPSELQERYPDGVPFQVSDKRDVYFEDKRQVVFTGAGQMLGGETKPSRLVPSHFKEKTEIIKENDHGKTIELQKHKKVESSRPGPKMTTEQFLNKLPASVIKNGKVIDIRSTVADNLKSGDKSEGSVIVVETEETVRLRARLELDVSERPASARDGTTLRIKSAGGNTTYILKMKYGDKIAQVRQYLAPYHHGEVQGYDIVAAFPRKVFENDAATLEECGLIPNATLHLKKTVSDNV